VSDGREEREERERRIEREKLEDHEETGAGGFLRVARVRAYCSFGAGMRYWLVNQNQTSCQEPLNGDEPRSLRVFATIDR